ncbi:uncharacterized protein VNE69_04127 [Vairimorpha necatrix]|uniref:Uncharacterized protein n=1 Tax=Vairimorpha necatrix TaxID=6039 RepID=A0AAX4JBR5_9MICR
MNYTWRIFKYSKLIDNPSDTFSYCKQNIDSVSQTVMHSQFDSQGIKKTQWLHIFMESNRFIEIKIYNNSLEITLNIHNPPNIQITILEKLDNFKIFKMCLKGRVLAFKFVNICKRFQIVFFNDEEASVFFKKFNNLIDFENEDEKHTQTLRVKFLNLFVDEKLDEDFLESMKTNETKEELIKKFLQLI